MATPVDWKELCVDETKEVISPVTKEECHTESEKQCHNVVEKECQTVFSELPCVKVSTVNWMVMMCVRLSCDDFSADASSC